MGRAICPGHEGVVGNHGWVLCEYIAPPWLFGLHYLASLGPIIAAVVVMRLLALRALLICWRESTAGALAGAGG